MHRAYPPFVNFIERSKEMIDECDKKYPKFHAFLKASGAVPVDTDKIMEDMC